MINITFTNPSTRTEHSTLTQYYLYLVSKNIGSPSVKTNYLDVPGADGSIDFTEFFGEVKYGNRTLTFDFVCIKPLSTQLTLERNLKKAIHGKKMEIAISDNTSYHYVGRIYVGEWTHTKNIGRVTITCDCEPWYYKNTDTTISKTVNGSATQTLSITSARTVIPKISTTAAVTIAWTGHSVSLSAGNDQIIPALILQNGVAINLTLTGTATVTFKYREGEF